MTFLKKILNPTDYYLEYAATCDDTEQLYLLMRRHAFSPKYRETIRGNSHLSYMARYMYSDNQTLFSAFFLGAFIFDQTYFERDNVTEENLKIAATSSDLTELYNLHFVRLGYKFTDALLANPNLPTELTAKLTQDENLICTLIDDESEQVRFALAQNEHISADILERLSVDESINVRYMTIFHHKMDYEMFLKAVYHDLSKNGKMTAFLIYHFQELFDKRLLNLLLFNRHGHVVEKARFVLKHVK